MFTFSLVIILIISRQNEVKKNQEGSHSPYQSNSILGGTPSNQTTLQCKQPAQQPAEIVIQSLSRILQTIDDTITAAITRVISAVEQILIKKKLFEGSVTLLSDMTTLVNLIKQRTNDLVLHTYFMDFYQLGIEKIDDSATFAFYNSLIEKIHRQSKSSKGSKKTVGQQIIVKNQISEKHQSPNKQTPLLNKSADRIAQVIDLSVEAQYHTSQQQQNLDKSRQASKNFQNSRKEYITQPRQLSERSKNLIKLIFGGVQPASSKDGQIIREVKISCLLPGEPTQYWKYTDRLEGGIVKVIFTT